MLKIMGQARCLMGIILAADPDGYVSLEPGSLLVDRHVNFKSVVKSVDLCLEGITLDCLILVFGAGAAKDQRRGERSRQHKLFHLL